MARTIDLRQKKEEKAPIPESSEAATKPQVIARNLSEKDYIAIANTVLSQQAVLAQEQDEQREDQQAELESARWEGSLRHHHPKMKAVIGFIAGLLALAVLTFLFQQNTFAAFLFVTMAVVLVLHVKRDIEICDFEVNYLGVRRSHQLIGYSEIESFWLDYLPDHNIKELSLHLKKKHLPFVKIPLHDQDPVQVRTIMIQFVPEVEHQDGLSEIIARRLGI